MQAGRRQRVVGVGGSQTPRSRTGNPNLFLGRHFQVLADIGNVIVPQKAACEQGRAVSFHARWAIAMLRCTIPCVVQPAPRADGLRIATEFQGAKAIVVLVLGRRTGVLCA